MVPTSLRVTVREHLADVWRPVTTSPGMPAWQGPLQAGMWLDRFDLANGLLLQAQWSGEMPYQRAGEVTGAVEDPRALLPRDAVLRLDRKDGNSRVVVVTLPAGSWWSPCRRCSPASTCSTG